MVIGGPIGERIRIYRSRRGLSQKELAGLVGRSESWLSQVERGTRSVDRLSVLIDIARVLRTTVETLTGYRIELPPNGEPELDGLEDIRAALSAYPGLGLSETTPGDLDAIEHMTAEVHGRYQAADYGAVARILPSLITSSDAYVVESRADERRRALVVQNQIYVVAAKLVTKVGDGQLAWILADRAATAAVRADSAILGAAAAYQVACAFLKLDRIEQAERVAITAAENILDDSRLGISLQGALFLIGSIIAARRRERREASDRLRHAQYLADALGEDGNYGWTSFGSTNVAIHTPSLLLPSSATPATSLRCRKRSIFPGFLRGYVAVAPKSTSTPHGLTRRAAKMPQPSSISSRRNESPRRPRATTAWFASCSTSCSSASAGLPPPACGRWHGAQGFCGDE